MHYGWLDLSDFDCRIDLKEAILLRLNYNFSAGFRDFEKIMIQTPQSTLFLCDFRQRLRQPSQRFLKWDRDVESASESLHALRLHSHSSSRALRMCDKRSQESNSLSYPESWTLHAAFLKGTLLQSAFWKVKSSDSCPESLAHHKGFWSTPQVVRQLAQACLHSF